MNRHPGELAGLARPSDLQEAIDSIFTDKFKVEKVVPPASSTLPKRERCRGLDLDAENESHDRHMSY